MKRELIVSGALAATCLVGIPAAAHAAPTTCNGKPVTIVAATGTTVGTEGDDVVAMEPGQWNEFDALGGNDTICITTPQQGLSFVATGTVEAGPGDDVVINLMPADTQDAVTRFGLGLGNDTFIGASVGEVVYADSEIFGSPEDPTLNLVGGQKDVITGANDVHTFPPRDGLNQDQVTFTGGEARITIMGPMAPDGLIDFGGASEATLGVSSNVDPHADLAANAQTGTITSRNGTLATWRGTVQNFLFSTNSTMPGDVTPPTVSFIGTDNPENVRFVNVPTGDLELGGGDDEVSTYSRIGPFIPRSVDGGDGSDSLQIDAACKELIVRLDSRARCDSTNGTVSSFERVDADTDPLEATTTMVVGTKKAEDIEANGRDVIVEAAAGDDEISAEGRSRTVVKAGAGDDRIQVNGRSVIARGDRGADIIRLGEQMKSDRPKAPRRDLLGGPGNDKLFGSKLKIGDRIIGGTGRDIADGRAGSRDYCIAEVRRNCERP